MATIHSSPPSPAQPETVGNVILLSMEWQTKTCIEQYEGMIDDFKEFLTVVNDGESKAEIFEYPPELVLDRHDNGEVASKAIFHSESCAYGPSQFSDADGYKIYISQYSSDGQRIDSEFTSFSLVGRNKHNGILYPNMWQTEEQTASIREWLRIKRPQSLQLLEELWDAAANPALNPDIAVRIIDIETTLESNNKSALPLHS